MEWRVRSLMLVILVLLGVNNVFSQQNFASNISRSSDAEKMIITYDIVPAEGIKSFSVVLFVTYQGSKVSTTSAYGDVGTNISPGREKAIVWYYNNDFKGAVENTVVEVYAYRENEPQAIFRITSITNKGYAPCEVVLSNNSSYANEYEWNFGDPASGARNLSYEKDPTHFYEKGGVYSISLTARNTQLRLDNTYYHSIEIKTHDPVTAGFTIEGNNQLAPARVSFTDNSVNADTWRWNFGDPSAGRRNESNKKDVRVSYRNPGTYNVQLIVRNNFSGLSDSLTKEVIVEKEKTVQAGFIYSKSSETAPSAVTFKNTSTSADRYEWNFGDPSSGNKNRSTEINPTHLFSEPGSYKVELSAWVQGTRKPSTFSEVITVNELPRPPEARFTIQNNNVIGPATILFTNNSLNATTFSWDFGDSGSGDENSSDKREPTYTYTKPGRYQVVLTASNPEFSRVSTATDWVVITSPTMTNAVPEARFTIENNNVPAPAIVRFADNSLNADSYLWNFGNPGSADNASELKNPVHVYTREGQYKVTLTVKNDGSGQTATYTEIVNVTGSDKPQSEKKTVAEVKPVTEKKPPAPPVAKFEINRKGDHVPVQIEFKNLSVNADLFRWSFGDFDSVSNESTSKDPAHYYQRPGKYTVTLEAENRETGEINKTSAEITLRSDFVTYFKSDELEGDSESIISLTSLPDNGFLAVMSDGGKGSSVCRFDNQGVVIKRQMFQEKITDIVPTGSAGSFMLTGLALPDRLFVQEINAELIAGQPLFFQENRFFRSDFALAKLKRGTTGEFGVIANTIDDRYPMDIFFQKADESGRIIPIAGRTFKYIGNKLVSDMIETGEGGFAITGGWQESSDALFRILFAKIDRAGQGDIQLVSSDMNIIGCAIENSFQGGFALLRAEEIRQKSNMYEISFTLLDSKGAPTDCANIFPCSVKKEDIFKYTPSLIRIEDGYVAASHGFNGVDYDISLFWIDKTGDLLLRQENFRMPGDQFVMDLKKAVDGGYIIAGTERVEGKSRPLIIKTDRWGKMNP